MHVHEGWGCFLMNFWSVFILYDSIMMILQEIPIIMLTLERFIQNPYLRAQLQTIRYDMRTYNATL